MKFPRFTWFLGEEFLENCSLKQITDGLWPFGWLKRSLANRVLHWEQLIMGERELSPCLWIAQIYCNNVPPLFLGGWGCKEIVCFQCCYNWVGIYHDLVPSEGRRIPTQPFGSQQQEWKHHRFGWGWSDPIILHRRFQGFRMIIRRSGQKWCKCLKIFEKVLSFLWTTSLSRWCGSYQM